jgi:hypothetical protein
VLNERHDWLDFVGAMLAAEIPGKVLRDLRALEERLPATPPEAKPEPGEATDGYTLRALLRDLTAHERAGRLAMFSYDPDYNAREKVLAALPERDGLMTLCIAEAGEPTAAALLKLCAMAARRTGKTLDDVQDLPLAAGLEFLEGKTKQGEENDNAPSKRSRKGIGGRKRLTKAEEEKRLALLREWWRAQIAGVERKTFCRDKDITLKTLGTYVNWHSTRKSRNTNSD